MHSAWDPISGSLDFYDLPTGKDGERDSKAVCNKSDLDARTFFLAHIEYWEGTLVFDTLLDALDAGTTRATDPVGDLKSGSRRW